MNNYPLIGGSICAVVLIVLASLTNVVGYQTAQSSNQKMIDSEIDGKELLFQTIVDMANNKEIQRVILGSELTSKRSFDSGMKFSTFTHPLLTKGFLNFAYQMGTTLLKVVSKSKIHSMLKQYQVGNPGMQKEISNVIEKDVTLKSEMTQLSSLSCDCENKNTMSWNYPMLCLVLYPIAFVIAMLWYFSLIILYHVPPFIQYLLDTIRNIGTTLNCFWMYE